MPELLILGVSDALPGAGCHPTQLLVHTSERGILVDCGESPLPRLAQAGVDSATLTDLILTHFHPDHVAGLPSFLMQLWISGHRQALNIHGLADTLRRAQALMELFGWGEWPNFYPVHFIPIEESRKALVIASPSVRVWAAPVRHHLPNIGLRFEFLPGEQTLAYTSDTEPCPALLELAHRATVLLHEASGEQPGHSSAAQAGELATRANVERLYLIHYPCGNRARNDNLAQAKTNFAGPVALASEMMKIEL